jgi:hypothetical protein
MKPIQLFLILCILLGCKTLPIVQPKQEYGNIAVRTLDYPNSLIDRKNIYYIINHGEKTYLSEPEVYFPADTTLITIGADGYDEITFYAAPNGLHLVSLSVVLDHDSIGSQNCNTLDRSLLSGYATNIFNTMPSSASYQDFQDVGTLPESVTPNMQYGPRCFLHDNGGFMTLNFLHTTPEFLTMRIKKKWKNSDSQVNVHLDEGSGGMLKITNK